MKQFQIPNLVANELTHIKNESRNDCFYAIERENEKTEAIELIKKVMSESKDFNIHYYFRVFTKFAKKEWSYEGNVMIFENKDVTNETRTLSGGHGTYECILWISSNDFSK